MIREIERSLALPWAPTRPGALPDDAAPINLLARELGLRLQEISRTVPAENVDELARFYDDGSVEDIDYEKYGCAFATEYLLRNYWKSAVALQRDRATYHHRILDLGSGSGAVSLAYLAYLSGALGPGRWTVHLELVDRSAVQLGLAEEFIGIAKRCLPNLDIRVEYVRADVRTWAPIGATPTCVFLGHVLTENSNYVSEILRIASDFADRDAELYVFERPHDRIWGEIETRVRELALPASIALVERESSLNIKYLKISLPHNKALLRIARTYFDAWRLQSVDLLREVFTDSASYHEKPFKPAFEGIDAIRHYWIEEVLPQRELSVELRGIAYSDCDVFAEWRASFIDRNAMRKTIVGVLILETTDQSAKAVRLREYFVRDAQ